MLACGEAAELEFIGGTHNHGGPPWDFLDAVFLPAIRRPGSQMSPDSNGTGSPPAEAVNGRRSCLPLSIAERELGVVRDKLGFSADTLCAQSVEAFGPGNIVMIAGEFEAGVAELATRFGRRGCPAEKVAAEAAARWRAYESAGAPVGQHVADQLVLPVALGAGGSFVTMTSSAHTTTNIQTIGAFLDIRFRVEPVRQDAWRVERV